MAIEETAYIWMDGALRPWREATVHVLSHALHYGTSFFEGIRVYDTPSGPAAFRLVDHIERLFDSAAIYGCELPYDLDTLVEACALVVRENGLKCAYLRPIAFYGYGEIGVAPSSQAKVQVAVAGFPWGAYLGEDGRMNGVDVCVSSWRRVAPGTIPAAAKAGGNYLSGVLISREAKSRGYAEGIGLDVNGLISEGAGENLFLVRKGKIYTPPASASILQGVTRDTVMKLASAEGLEVIEQPLPRESLYLADEIFFTGTAAEITPVRSVDGRRVKANGRGRITALLQERFFGLFTGVTADRWNWLRYVGESKEAHRAAAIAV
ncbi:MAG: branched-chain amino acid transaminase [Alphaproteobacteria bacterium]|nr:branched-chain amino acid transaminase [Alphaproteobacteria bacterium]